LCSSAKVKEGFNAVHPFFSSSPIFHSPKAKMAAADNEEIPDVEKVRIASDFIRHSPPGEFNEVFNDVRVLLSNDTLLKEGASGAFSHYNKDQLTPARVEGSDYPCLITDYNDLGGGRFADPRSRQSFRYDHLRKEASDFQPWQPDSKLESLRSAIDAEATAYALNHYKHGICSTFSSVTDTGSEAVIVCVEDHQFQPKNYWNGRWRSIWTVVVSGNQAEVSGVLKVQVHYYEDGNVQLVSSKDVKEAISLSSGEETAAKELILLMESSESDYQTAISENYTAMSDTTFKALRRQLPVTRTKIDWNKIVSYSIGKELKNQ
jgi:capping protein alpha